MDSARSPKSRSSSTSARRFTIRRTSDASCGTIRISEFAGRSRRRSNARGRQLLKLWSRLAGVSHRYTWPPPPAIRCRLKQEGEAMRVVRAVLIFSITLHATGALFAQDLHHFVRPTEKLAVGTFSPEPNLYGTSVESTYVISSLSFQVLQNGSGPTYTTGGGFDRYFTGGAFPYFDAPIVLPTGASIIGIELQACDSHATANISAYIFGGIIFGEVPGVFSLGGETTSGTLRSG